MKKIISLVCCLLATMVIAEDVIPQNNDADLASLAVKEIKIPLEHLQNAYKEFAWLEFPKLVVDVKRNSTPIWRTPAINYDGKGARNTFRYDLSVAENSTPIFLSSNDEFIFEVYLVSNDVSVQTWRGVGGSAGGAAAGAGAGALLGLCGGPFAPLTVPVGAGIGAIVGAIAGGATFASLPTETSIKVVEFKVLGKDLYSQEHVVKIETTAFIDEEQKYAQLILTGQRKDTIKNDGELKKNGKYLCRLRNVKLSSSAKGVKDGGKYYAKICQHGNKEVKIRLGEIPLDAEWPLEEMGLFLLQNKLGTGTIQIFRDSWGVDPLVFEASLGSSAKGDTWLYSGKIESEDEQSYATFETFSVEEVEVKKENE